MKIKTLFSLVALILSSWISSANASIATPGYYRSPALHQDSLVFTAEGDLWHTNTTDGIAKRITTHPSEEIMASISPDGQWIAYIANYQGNFEVYVININGGSAKRLSFENSRVRVQGWTNDGKVLYATDSGFGPANYWTLKIVNPKDLSTETIPLADAIEGTISQDLTYLYFTRFGLQVTGDNSKVYRGGAQGQLWRFNLTKNAEATPLTSSHQGSARKPMLYKDRLFFISDASGNDNLWSMTTAGDDLKQETHYVDWSIRGANIHKNKIVFQLGADIKEFDIDTSSAVNIDINLISDFAQRQERWLNKPLKYFNNASIAGDANKVVINARGKLAVGGLHNSRLVEINTPAKSRTRSARLSSDAKWVYAINDSSGENEIWQYAADGSDSSSQLTKNGQSFRWNLYLSPNGRYIAHDDRDGNLWLLDIDKGHNKKIASLGRGFSAFDQVIWSKDSKLIAYAGYNKNSERSLVRLYSLFNDSDKQLTSDKYESYSPTFSNDGKWLYFLSERSFKSNPTSPWGDRNMGPAFDKRTQIFAYALTADKQFPFANENELTSKTLLKDKDDKAGKKAEKPSIEWDEITDSLWQVPVPAGNYSDLSAAAGGLYLIQQKPANSDLIFIKYDRVSAKLQAFAAAIQGYQLADNREKILFGKKSEQGPNLFIVNTGDKAPKDLIKAKVNSKDWQMAFSPMDEWQQMFQDAWLMHREFLFDTNMRGLDWQATKAKYQPLVERITSRNELNDIFAQMMGELNSLHSQVRGGDSPQDLNAAKASTLGARYQQDANGIKITTIYQTDKELPQRAAPLAKPGVNVKIGDVIVAINGKNTTTIAELHNSLRNQAGKQILLSLKRDKAIIKTVVTPVTSRVDAQLRYRDWVYTKQQLVAGRLNGNIGYMHLNAMTSNDINEFAREFYDNFNKDALIIDVRRNRGGNIDSWIIEKLLRRVWMFWQEGNNAANSNMQQTFRGHLVVLTDQLTYSDGETFAAGIKSLGLAPLIGKTTTGAGVWLTGRNRLTDNGMARVAELPQYALDGTWVVEGRGVSPDIEVDNLPYATFSGYDAQLEAGINYLTDKIKQQPIKPLLTKPMPVSGPAADIKAID